MQLKLFVLPVKNLNAAEAEMNAFLRSHRMLSRVITPGYSGRDSAPRCPRRVQRRNGSPAPDASARRPYLNSCKNSFLITPRLVA